MSMTPRTDTLQWAMENRPLTPREEEMLNAMRKMEIESDQYKREFIKCVDAAAIFQPGGRFYGIAKLRLGGSTVVEGIAWLVSEYDRLQSALTAGK